MSMAVQGYVHSQSHMDIRLICLSKYYLKHRNIYFYFQKRAFHTNDQLLSM